MTRSLGIIVGRGQSKRLPGKMLRPLAGHPLIGWAARAAAASELSRVIVSTDAPEIAAAARDYGVEAPFDRPAALATDDIGNDKVLEHALSWVEEDDGTSYDIIVLIQPTAPFIRPQDINACVADVAGARFSSCFTARIVETPPEWMFRATEGGGVEPLMRGPWLDKNRKGRALTPSLRANGAAWATRTEAFRASGSVYNAPMNATVMDSERSVDVDYETDLALAEMTAEINDFQITPAAASL